MTRKNLSFFAALFVVAMAFAAGCTVGFDVEESDKFPCTTDDDCISGFQCTANLCRSVVGPSNNNACIDDDQDGYGVGESQDLQQCPACTEGRPNGCVQADCDDTNDAINPGAGEICDGEDNNCNDETDEPTSCENSGDCPLEGSDINTSCNAGTCQYLPFNTIAAPECSEPLQCVGGAREAVPPACQ